MLPPGVVNCIRETVEVELAPRNDNVIAAIEALMAASRGYIAELDDRAQIGVDELRVRAEIIWAVITRCQGAFGTFNDAELTEGLRQQVEELELTRFRGHLTVRDGGVYGEAVGPVHAGV